MATLADANILLRLAQPNSEQYIVAADAVEGCLHRNEQVVLCPQTFYEFWSVATRPVGTAGNGLGLSVEEALQEMRQFEDYFPLLPDTPAIYGEWRRLVEQWSITGRQAHDARLIATMLAHSIPTLLTFDIGRLGRYEQRGLVIAGYPLRVLHPADAAP